LDGTCRGDKKLIQKEGPVWRNKLTWGNNIKLYLKEMNFEGMDLIQLDQDWMQWQALVNMVMTIRVP
jgi:hypothetical protein